jgi:hypothetical protein
MTMCREITVTQPSRCSLAPHRVQLQKPHVDAATIEQTDEVLAPSKVAWPSPSRCKGKSAAVSLDSIIRLASEDGASVAARADTKGDTGKPAPHPCASDACNWVSPLGPSNATQVEQAKRNLGIVPCGPQPLSMAELSPRTRARDGDEARAGLRHPLQG